MLIKDKLLKLIDKMPEQFSVEDLMEEVILMEKIQKGIDQSERGEIVSDENLDKHLPEWLRSTGPNKH
jgi:hypothetical protein